MSICHKNNSSLTSKLVNRKQILKAAEEIVAFKKNTTPKTILEF